MKKIILVAITIILLVGCNSTEEKKKAEKADVFIKNNMIFQVNKDLDEYAINNVITLMKDIESNYLKTDNIYYSIIPDKNYYMNNEYDSYDYNKLKELFNSNLDYTYIDIFNELSLDSYYNTDIHWRQEKLDGVTNKLLTSMGLNKITLPHEINEFNNFYGGLYSKIDNNLDPDKIVYLSNELLDNIKVYNMVEDTYQNVYNEEYLKNKDPYDIYLSGPTSVLVIENKNQKNGKELVIFRDSFASSLVPLMISSYSKITLIDLRYISSKVLNEFEAIKFNKNQDILFLYSVPVINNSFILK